MKDKLISVIIPCYNVDKWVKKCLDSVLAQTYKEIEVIVIDDGSTDDTADILASYTDSRLRIITQKNKGVSMARNNGITYASGEFLTFVDSDDWLEPQMYEKLYSALASNDADMAVCNYNLVYDDHIVDQYSKSRNETVNISDDVYSYFCNYCVCNKPNNYIWTRLYKTDIVKKSEVVFEDYKIADDTLFNFKLLPHINRVTWIPYAGYCYFQRVNSNVYTVAKKNNLAKVYADTFDALANYYEKNNFNEFTEVLPIHAFSRLRSVFFYSRLAGLDEDSINSNIKTGFSSRKIYDYLTGSVK